MKKIYIAGKISGECETPELMLKCKKKFQHYGFTLFEGVCTFSDGIFIGTDEVSFTHGLSINYKYLGKDTWENYMKRDLSVLLTCNEIHMLPDWKSSKGACIERKLAEDLGIKIIEVKDFSYLD